MIGGIGLGIGYISPVSTLIKWFPDRPGLATGMAIMGFGGGALIASPASNQLLSFFDSGFNPDDKGAVANGTALSSTFLTLGIIYTVFMLIGAALVRVPPGHSGDEKAVQQPGRNGALVSASSAIRTPQFAFLWVMLFCNVTAGIGILEQAAPMIQDFFRTGDGESSVSAAEAAGFVGILSLANMAGRFLWSTVSDYIGRKPTYMIYLGVGLVLYALVATIGSTSPAVFVILAAVIISYYGGGFATVPAYLKDMFGTLEVGAIHGRLLTAWAAAGVAGPLIVNKILDSAGEPGSLVADDYNLALFTMVGVLAVGFVANLMIKPVDEKYFDEEAVRDEAGDAGNRSLRCRRVASRHEHRARRTHREHRGSRAPDQHPAGRPGLVARPGAAGLRALRDPARGAEAAQLTEQGGRAWTAPVWATRSAAYSPYAN